MNMPRGSQPRMEDLIPLPIRMKGESFAGYCTRCLEHDYKAYWSDVVHAFETSGNKAPHTARQIWSGARRQVGISTDKPAQGATTLSEEDRKAFYKKHSIKVEKMDAVKPAAKLKTAIKAGGGPRHDLTADQALLVDEILKVIREEGWDGPTASEVFGVHSVTINKWRRQGGPQTMKPEVETKLRKNLERYKRANDVIPGMSAVEDKPTIEQDAAPVPTSKPRRKRKACVYVDKPHITRLAKKVVTVVNREGWSNDEAALTVGIGSGTMSRWLRGDLPSKAMRDSTREKIHKFLAKYDKPQAKQIDDMVSNANSMVDEEIKARCAKEAASMGVEEAAVKVNGDIQCSFCGKSQKEVRKLIAAPMVYICDECVELCNDILNDGNEKVEASVEDHPTETADPPEPEADMKPMDALTLLIEDYALKLMFALDIESIEIHQGGRVVAKKKERVQVRFEEA